MSYIDEFTEWELVGKTKDKTYHVPIPEEKLKEILLLLELPIADTLPDNEKISKL